MHTLRESFVRNYDNLAEDAVTNKCMETVERLQEGEEGRATRHIDS